MSSAVHDEIAQGGKLRKTLTDRDRFEEMHMGEKLCEQRSYS